jgi:hypothetical protein
MISRTTLVGAMVIVPNRVVFDIILQHSSKIQALLSVIADHALLAMAMSVIALTARELRIGSSKPVCLGLKEADGSTAPEICSKSLGR